jgi:hypothetical protein
MAEDVAGVEGRRQCGEQPPGSMGADPAIGGHHARRRNRDELMEIDAQLPDAFERIQA